MSVARSVDDVLSEHALFEVQCIDRRYVNVYVPQLEMSMTAWRSPSSGRVVVRPRSRVARAPGTRISMSVPPATTHGASEAVNSRVMNRWMTNWRSSSWELWAGSVSRVGGPSAQRDPECPFGA